MPPLTWVPSSTETAYDAYQRYIAEASTAGEILIGGETLPNAGTGLLRRAHGRQLTCPMTTASGSTRCSRRLWLCAAVESNEEAMQLANDVALGLTAGLLQRRPGRGRLVPR